MTLFMMEKLQKALFTFVIQVATRHRNYLYVHKGMAVTEM